MFLYKINLFFIYIVINISLIYGADMPDDEEKSVTGDIQMVRHTHERHNSPSLLTSLRHGDDSPLIPEDSPVQTTEESSRLLKHSTNREHADSVASELLGHTEVVFATPFLEKHAKCTAFLWNIAHGVLEDLESITHGVATALIAYSGSAGSQQLKVAAFAIQVGLVATGIQKLSNFSEKVILVRQKQVLAYEKQNKTQLMEEGGLTLAPIAARLDLENDPHTYSTKGLENFFVCCAVTRLVMWDHLGVAVILLQTGSYSLVNWASIVSESERQKLILLATFCSIAGSFCSYYIKSLSKNAKTMALKARDARILNRMRAEI